MGKEVVFPLADKCFLFISLAFLSAHGNRAITMVLELIQQRKGNT